MEEPKHVNPARALWQAVTAGTVAFLKRHPVLRSMAAAIGVILLIVGAVATVLWKVPLLSWLDGSQVAVPCLAAGSYLLGVWFQSRTESKGQRQQVFDISPIQQSGQNIYSRIRSKSSELSEQFLVRLTFNFWTKHQIELINIELSYASGGMPQSPKIAFDFANPVYEKVDGSYRLMHRRMLNADSVIHVFIEQEFVSRPYSSVDYGRATVEIEFVGPEWVGVHSLRASGNIAPGGHWENVSVSESCK